MTDEIDARRVEGIVHALTEQATASCSDCGGEIDVSEAESPIEVVMVLEKHGEENHD